MSETRPVEQGGPVIASSDVRRDDRRSLALYTMKRLSRSKSAILGGLLLLAIGLSAMSAPKISPYDPIKSNQRSPLEAPSMSHLMGTDRFGRDILSRVLWGGRLSLSVGIVSVGIAACSGVVLGLLAGYYGRRMDTAIMRFVDLLLAFPSILLALAVIATLGSSLRNLMIAVGISAIPNYVRVTRGMVLGLKEREFVLAAQAVGCRDRSILFRHILPNILAPVIVLATLGVAAGVITGSTLSFLGLGIRPPTPEWGNMLADGRELLESAWWAAFFPGLAIMVAVLSINLLGDGLLDALDPHIRL
jgi:ABC-type dipeptide/oligopeptide/nickel transport system permease subunit